MRVDNSLSIFLAFVLFIFTSFVLFFFLLPLRTDYRDKKIKSTKN